MLHSKKTFPLTLALLLSFGAYVEPARATDSSESIVAQAQENETTFPLLDTLPEGSLVKISSSENVEPINNSLKEKFEEQYSDATVEVTTTDSDSALESVANKETDLAAISRPLTEAEEAQGFKTVPINREKIAIIVGKDNPYSGNLTIDQFAKIFRGEITNWSEVGGASQPIKLVDLSSANDTRRSFPSYPVFQSAEFKTGSNATVAPDDSTETVAGQLGTNGIGYAPVSAVEDLEGVKVVTMHQTLPDDQRYPFSQPNLYVYQEELSPAAQGFLGFATAEAGQGIIQEAAIAKPLPGVEFETETAPETTAEVPTDTTTEVAPETTAETPTDTTAEVAPETTAETPTDTTAEVIPETTAETPTDTTAEVAPETTAEVPADTTAEVAPETTAEVPADTTAEVAPETTAEVPTDTTAEVIPETTAEVPADTTTEVAPEVTQENKGNWWWYLPLLLLIPLIGFLIKKGKETETETVGSIESERELVGAGVGSSSATSDYDDDNSGLAAGAATGLGGSAISDRRRRQSNLDTPDLPDIDGAVDGVRTRRTRIEDSTSNINTPNLPDVDSAVEEVRTRMGEKTSNINTPDLPDIDGAVDAMRTRIEDTTSNINTPDLPDVGGAVEGVRTPMGDTTSNINTSDLPHPNISSANDNVDSNFDGIQEKTGETFNNVNDRHEFDDSDSPSNDFLDRLQDRTSELADDVSNKASDLKDSLTGESDRDR